MVCYDLLVGDELLLMCFESDDDWVWIVIVYSSKGLEYLVVFLLFVWSGGLCVM